VFMNAPHVVAPTDLPDSVRGPIEAFELTATDAEKEARRPRRAWWTYNIDRTACFGIEISILYVRDTLKVTTFQGIFGYSQGAALAGVIAAILERPESCSPFIIDGKPIHPKLEFFIAACGFIPPGPLIDSIISPTKPKLTTPSLHVLGQNDTVIPAARSQSFLESCDAKFLRVERHENGHRVPTNDAWPIFFKDYLTGFPDAQIAAPSRVTL
ncbi:FSH1-domain-containing protein, partial [Hysterangium stoloniferum]